MSLNKFIIFVPFTQLYPILYMNLISINRYCHKGHIIQEITATQRDTGVSYTQQQNEQFERKNSMRD